MAEKKKPTTTKAKTTKRAATTKAKKGVKPVKVTKTKTAPVKKKNTKAVSTAKKAPAVTKSKASTKKVVAQKTPKPVATGSTYFNWNEWTAVFSQATSCWKAIVGKFSLLILLTFALQWLNAGFYVSARNLLLGGPRGLENLIANAQIGTFPELKITLLLLLLTLGWILISAVILIMCKVAILGLVKSYVKKTPQPAVQLFFKEGFRQLGGYFLLGCRSFWFMLWPVLVFLAVMFGGVLMLPESAHYLTLGGMPLPLVFNKAVETITVLLLVWRMVYVLFAGAVFVHAQQGVKKSFATALKITKQAWGYVFCMWGLLIALLYGVNQLLFQVTLIDPVVLIDAVNPEEQLGLVDLLAFLLSLFIFAPIAASFQYVLMLKVAKNQGIKL